MIESELSYNTRIFGKEPKYFDCEDCYSKGFFIEINDEIEEKINCERCEGKGFFESED